jgi:pyrroline-5-carboxylate reductase
MRAMPNRPALLGAGATGAYAPPQVAATARHSAEAVLRAVGEVVWVGDEPALDVVTALSGSGPAYFFLLAELMARAGTDLGLEAASAQRLAAVTLYGAGLMAQSGTDLAQLRASVSSPGGTTQAALAALDAADLGGAVLRALKAATTRSRELAAQA